MKPVLPLFVFIDACGWEIIKNDPFGQSLCAEPQAARFGLWLQFGVRAVHSFRTLAGGTSQLVLLRL